MIYCEIFSFPVMWSFIPAMYSPEHRLKKRRIHCKEMMGHAWNSHTHEKKERKGANAEKLYRKVYVLLIPSYIIQHIDVHRLFGNE